MPPAERHTVYRVTFYDKNNQPWRLDTIDPAKIGPWLAEMFMISPYRVDSPGQVVVETSFVILPGR